MNTGADFSECKKFRYNLWRIWDESKPKVAFIGLNPSTANDKENDPTIRRVIGFAKKWGYGGVHMINLFPFVTPYPKELVRDNIITNRIAVEHIAKSCDKIIFAWGNFKEAENEAKYYINLFKNAEALIINKNGSPRHPLYVPLKTIPVKYNTRL